MLDTSTGQPMTVRPKNGMTSEMPTTNRMALRGEPFPSSFPSHCHFGRTSSAESEYSRRLIATVAATIPVKMPANIAAPISATPHFPSTPCAAAKVGIESSPESPILAPM